MNDTFINNISLLVKSGIDLKTKEAAAYLNLSHRTLEKYRYTGEGPKFNRYGKSIRYEVKELEKWKKARLFNSTSERANNYE